MADVILKCTDVKKSFKARGNSINVLKGINLSVRRGEKIVVKGKSGEGKSVLLWLISGLDKPDSGGIFFKNNSLTELSNSDLAKLRRGEISIIFQNFNLIESWTAIENIESAIQHYKLAKETKREAALQMLRKVGLENRSGNLPSELSMGQQQRVAIARALITKPKLIIADEPTGDVDPETASEIINLLVNAVDKEKATLIIATHGNFPLDIADRVFVLKDGLVKENAQ